jgi:outer membrane protein assembly factor BamB
MKMTISAFAVFFALQTPTMAQTTVWESFLSGPGTFASPRTWDLNQDGIKDIVIGDGNDIDSIGNLTALNGIDGTILWHVSRGGELYASAQFLKVNGDNYYDVIIGGRVANLFCVDGLTGDLIWEFDTTQSSPGGEGWLQFYEPQTVNDITGDGLRDLIVINGGDPTALSGQQIRKPGHLLLLDASSGTVLHQAVMPDSAESYSSLALIEGSGPDQTYIYFGSGGETVAGSLWRATLTQLLNDDITAADELITDNFKGFIAPPVLADLTSDNVLDIVGASFGGMISLVNGATLDVEWSFYDPGLETYGVPAIGDFNGDGQLDVACSLNHGIWTQYDFAVQLMLNGANGSTLRSDSIGLQIISPLAYDIDGDGKDEVIMSYNIFPDSTGAGEVGQAIINYETGIQTMFANPGNTNVASTPCLDDLDSDGDLELIEIHSQDPNLGFVVKVWNTGFQVIDPLRWTAYRGTYFDCIYQIESPTSAEIITGKSENERVYVNADGVKVVFQNSPISVRLTDVLGKEYDLKQSFGSLSFSIDNISTGIYFLNYRTKMESKTIKLYMP